MRRLVPEAIFIAISLAGGVFLIAADNPSGGNPESSIRLERHSLPEKNAIAIGKWTDNRCGTCHEIDPLFSHPVDVVPTMAVPPEFPLTNGRLTCATCHVSDDADSHRRARLEGSPLLRNAHTSAQLCVQCHSPGSSDPVDLHALNATDFRAHLTSPGKLDDAEALRQDFGPGFGDIDLESQQCLTCHDGTFAGGDLTTGHGSRRRGRRSQSHPIGVHYPADARSRYMVPQESLDERIRLYDGAVGCGSCHSPYSRIESHLVLPNSGSNLCLTCHAE